MNSQNINIFVRIMVSHVNTKNYTLWSDNKCPFGILWENSWSWSYIFVWILL